LIFGDSTVDEDEGLSFWSKNAAPKEEDEEEEGVEEALKEVRDAEECRLGLESFKLDIFGDDDKL